MPEDAPTASTVTPGGLVFCGLMVAVLFAGYAASQLAPETAFGRLTASLGTGLWTAMVVGVGVIGERILKIAGVSMLQTPKRDDGQPPLAPDAAPAAAGEDGVAEDQRPPVQVSRARFLLLASFALGFLGFIPGINPEPMPAGPGLLVAVVIVVILCALYLWLVTMLYRGKNWARWTMLAFLVFSWAMDAANFTAQFARSPIAGIIDFASFAMGLVACWYLFLSAGARWYAARSASRARGPAAP
jgi:hypothetical protein